MLGHLQEPVPQLRAVTSATHPATLQAVIDRALAKHPEERFPTAGALASAYMAAIAAPSEETEVDWRLDRHEDQTIVDIDKRDSELDETVIRDVDADRDIHDHISDKRDEKRGGLSRRTFLIAGAASGLTALACVGGVFAIAGASGRGAATPTTGLVAAAPSSTSVPPTATVAAANPTATAIPPTATSVPPTATNVPSTATNIPSTATSVLPTATLAPTRIPPTPTLRRAVGDEVLSDWATTADPEYNAAYDTTLGGYRMFLNRVGSGLSQYSPSRSSFSNFELFVDCRLTGTSIKGWYGLRFHASPSQSGTVVTGYRLLLSENGNWVLEYINANNTVTEVKPSTRIDGATAPTQIARLSVTSRNRALAIGINGKPVGTFEAIAPASGWIGLAVVNYADSRGIDAVFTNLRITSL